MATYPDVPTKTRQIKPVNKLKTDISHGGTLRAQDLSATTQYEITLDHPLLTAAQVTTLEDFFTANKNTVITTLALSDGNTYDCLHVHEPEVQNEKGYFARCTQRLIGTRN